MFCGGSVENSNFPQDAAGQLLHWCSAWEDIHGSVMRITVPAETWQPFPTLLFNVASNLPTFKRDPVSSTCGGPTEPLF